MCWVSQITSSLNSFSSFHRYAQSSTRDCRQIHKIKSKRFSYVKLKFYSAFLAKFVAKMSKFVFWVAGWVFIIKSKNFKDFLKFPDFLRSYLKGATKFYFMWYLRVVIILYKRACISQYFISALLENYCFIFLSFLPALCFEFNFIFINLITCMIQCIGTTC